jgi:hypothetical protein
MLLSYAWPQCDKVAIVKDSSVVYFGPYNAAAINKHMPVDHMMGATVEGKESATAPAAAEKVCRLVCSRVLLQLLVQQHASIW